LLILHEINLDSAKLLQDEGKIDLARIELLVGTGGNEGGHDGYSSASTMKILNWGMSGLAFSEGQEEAAERFCLAMG
jgi:hypothetical protein